jgi:2-oxoglutarate dehydrogenase E1 component
MRSSSESAPRTSLLDQLDATNLEFVEQLLESWSESEQTVPSAWAAAFRELAQLPAGPVGSNSGPLSSPDFASPLVRREARMLREFGYLSARLDPLAINVPPAWADVLEQQRVVSDGAELWNDTRPLNESEQRAIDELHAIYCGSIGYEFMHLRDPQERSRLIEWIETRQGSDVIAHAEKVRTLDRLIAAGEFEQFVRRKFIGAKTFSLEGCEVLLPLLDRIVDRAAEAGVDEVVVGMAHRGRLNVLTNLIGKQPREIFHEFEDAHPDEYVGRGDVKYHLGYSCKRAAANGRILHLALCFNPSHLEFVSAVVLGRVRAMEDLEGDNQRTRSLPLLIHGDAAFAGEGVVQETLNLAHLQAYETGGAVHIIINNQLGFTTQPSDSRSTLFASDIARGLQVPIFHVNADEPEAVLRAVDVAMRYRNTFHRDVLIDLIGYRRWGHNEGDEPSFTQPLVYQAIQHRPTIDVSYGETLVASGELTVEEVNRMRQEFQRHLRQEFEQRSEVNPKHTTRNAQPSGLWEGYFGGLEPDPATELYDSCLSLPQVEQLLTDMADIPPGFHLHRKLQETVAARRRMAIGAEPLDWASAEALAFASLAIDGYHIRLAGQDSIRGTFSQRHSMFYDQVDGHPYSIFSKLPATAASIEVINSPLCEAAALGFEYGYSMCSPRSLVLWEAQFGDFANAGQVIIDQFIVGAEGKWNRLTGLVLLLPHGFEGQGPEHSSARLERFLGLIAQHNLQIVQPTTPAQYFHVLRRQALRKWQKPLIVLTPKSLLRHPQVRSAREEFVSGGFQRVLPDAQAVDPQQIRRILLCSGKVYFDLLEERQQQNRDDVAILRIEQFYPLNRSYLQAALDRYPTGTPVVWVQEEPKNAGAWRYWRYQYGDLLFDRFPFQVVAREECASPSTGSRSAHKREQELLMAQAIPRST